MEVGTTFFTGLTAAEIASAVDSLERRHFEAGTVLMAEGDIPGEMYVLNTGSAEVLVEDHTGAKQMVSRVGPGETIGEISLLTKQPASATVRIAEESEVLVLAESKLAELTERFPGLERNMLRILATRLVRANRLAVGRQPGRLTVLDDRGAPPLLGFALSASMAWHTRARTLHVVLADSLPEELAALARARAEAHAQRGGPGAELVAGSPQREFGPERIESTLIRLAEDYDDVVVQLAGAADGRDRERRQYDQARLIGGTCSGFCRRARFGCGRALLARPGSAVAPAVSRGRAGARARPAPDGYRSRQSARDGWPASSWGSRSASPSAREA